MMRLRLIPAVLFATASLLGLKAVDLVLNRTPSLVPSAAAESAEHGGHGTAAAGKPEAGKADHDKPGPAPGGHSSRIVEVPPPTATAAPADSGSSDRAILEHLSERRAELEARAKDLDTRENLLKAAEAKLEARVGELKALEAKLAEGERKQDDDAKAKIKALVTMYEAMRPKDAARIFSKLDAAVLLQIVEQMNPRKMADILANMDSEPAQKLTVELAARGNKGKAGDRKAWQDLPKIETRP